MLRRVRKGSGDISFYFKFTHLLWNLTKRNENELLRWPPSFILKDPGYCKPVQKKKKKVNLGSPSETVQFDDMVCISLTPLPLKLHKGCMIKRLARESVFTKKIGEI